MILDLIPEDNQILHQKVKKCSYNLDRKELSKTLIENMKHHDGLGLSANQIGIPERAFAMIRNVEYNEIMVCFNPKIVKTSTKKSVMEEGCLSLPEQYADVERPKQIIVEYTDENEKLFKREIDGYEARILQHEIDHLSGKLFVDYLSSLKRNILIKKVKKLQNTKKR